VVSVGGYAVAADVDMFLKYMDKHPELHTPIWEYSQPLLIQAQIGLFNSAHDGSSTSADASC
jgi:hypothetical protein